MLRMRLALSLLVGLATTAAQAQDTKVLLCTASTQLNLSAQSIEPLQSDETYTWELNYDESGELVSVSAPFNCMEGTEDWTIGASVISLACQRGVQGVAMVQLSAEIDRYAQSFVISGIGEATEASAQQDLWVQEGRCELARRKF